MDLNAKYDINYMGQKDRAPLTQRTVALAHDALEVTLLFHHFVHVEREVLHAVDTIIILKGPWADVKI